VQFMPEEPNTGDSHKVEGFTGLAPEVKEEEKAIKLERADDAPRTAEGIKIEVGKNETPRHESPPKPEKQRCSDKLFNLKNLQLGQAEILKLEYMYDSEEEFGDEDVFQKTEIVKPPDSLKDKLNELYVNY